MGPKGKLENRDEFLIMLMKLKLHVLFEDLSDQLGISGAHCVYNCWLRVSAKLLHHLILPPDKEGLLATTPIRFKRRGFQNVCDTLDCSEIFIGVPKNYKMQALT